MLRIIGGVILGYVSMAVVVFVGLTGAYLAMGADRAFQPGVYDVSSAWLVVWFIVSLAAALVGGKVCALIGRNAKAVYALAAIVFLLGILSGLSAMKHAAGEPKPRTGDVPNLEAMMQARQPSWVLLLTPVIGATGALLGGRTRRPNQSL